MAPSATFAPVPVKSRSLPLSAASAEVHRNRLIDGPSATRNLPGKAIGITVAYVQGRIDGRVVGHRRRAQVDDRAGADVEQGEITAVGVVDRGDHIGGRSGDDRR